MKRVHVHLSVKDMKESIAFYNDMFGMDATVEKDDYAKWEPEDLAICFAISEGKDAGSLNHLGIKMAEEELKSLAEQSRETGQDHKIQDDVSCCYSRSNKVWMTDPQGVQWEHFSSHGQADVLKQTGSSCCAPSAGASSSCC